MRVYVAGVQHESSSFSPIPTSLASFRTVQWGRVPREATFGVGYGEACELAASMGLDVVAGPLSDAQPSLPATASAWASLRDGVVDGLRDALATGPVDIVFLCLHGAQMADGVDDCEGELLGLVRTLAPQAAIGALLDLHANVTSAMLEQADLVVSCREYPHIDYDVRAEEMLPVLIDIARGATRPTTAGVRLAAPGIYPTTEPPMLDFVRRFTEAQSRPGVLAVSVNHGFEGSDHPDMGSSVVVTTDGDPELAASMAHELAGAFLEVVRSRSWRGPDVPTALDEAFAFEGRPVVVADRSDNAGGGAASDSTYVLEELIARGARDVALALLWDPVAVRLCHDAGDGARIPLRIGGKAGPQSGRPLDVFAEVTCVRSDAKQALFGKGEPRFRLGRSAAIRLGGPGGIDVVMNEYRQQVFSRHCFSEHGIDPVQRHVLVVKSTQHFMNDFGGAGGGDALAAHVVRCDAPGTMTPDLASLPYVRIRRPMLGIDPVDELGIEPMPIAPR